MTPAPLPLLCMHVNAWEGGGMVNTVITLKFEKGGGAYLSPSPMVAPPPHARPYCI